jgi:hypothetical protein
VDDPPLIDPPDEPDRIILRDEDGTEFAFRNLRTLRDGIDLFLIAEREDEKTLHVLMREGETVGLVKDKETLGRVALRLEILRRAMDGELVEWTGEDGTLAFFGVFHSGEVEGRHYLLAADLADPATILAFEPVTNGVAIIDDDRFLGRIHEQLEAATTGWEAAWPNLEAAVLGMRGERIEITDPTGRTRSFRGAGRLVFEGRDVVFLAPEDDPTSARAAEVKGGGRLEFLEDEAFLDRLRAHLDRARQAPS